MAFGFVLMFYSISSYAHFHVFAAGNFSLFPAAIGSHAFYSNSPSWLFGSFGFFGNFSNDSPARGVTLVDVCDKIKLGGKDQYGESYKMSNLQVNGPSITFDWINSYGEGATTTLTRTDGTDWPALILN